MHGDYSSYSNDSIFIKLPKETASRIIENLQYYNKQGCCTYGGVIVIFNEAIMLHNNYMISDATILFFLNNREYDLYRSFLGSYIGDLKFSISKSGKNIIINSPLMPHPHNRTGLKLTNIKNGKTDGDYLFYEWNISENPNYYPSKTQEVDFTIEKLNLDLPY